MAEVEQRVVPAATALPVQNDTGISYTPAIRIMQDRAIAVVNRDAELAEGAPPLVGRDRARSLVVVQTEPRPDGVAVIDAGPSTQGPRYVVVTEATSLGAVVRPLYVGRTDLLPDPRWTDPLLTIGAIQQNVSPGSALFSLTGRFIGLVAANGGPATVIPAAALADAVTTIGSVANVRADLGIEVQPLTAALARGAGASRGVMIRYVQPDVSSAADLRAGDVITSIDGVGLTTVAGFRYVVQSRSPGADVTLTTVRDGEPGTITVKAFQAGRAAAHAGLGATFRSVPSSGLEVVSLDPAGAIARAGLQRGDLIVSVDGRRMTDAAAIARAFQAATSGQVLLLTVQGAVGQRVVALEKP